MHACMRTHTTADGYREGPGFLRGLFMEEIGAIVQGNENYEELKQSTKTFLQAITSDDMYYGLFLLLVMIIILRIIDLVFYPLRHKSSIQISFVKACMKAFVMITIGMRICSMIPLLSDFTSQILMSSSLIVVVLGFVFQEGLSNIVHGFILSVFKPFKVGDRVKVTVDGQNITGFIVSIDTRQTIIQNILNSSHVIIPNAKMDTCVIENNYFDGNRTASSFLDVAVTYESDVEKAMQIMGSLIENHPYVAKLREEEKIEDHVKVMVRELGESSVGLRAAVVTRTVDENFSACSDIRMELLKAFRDEPDIHFGYPHLQISDRSMLHTVSGR